MPKRSAASMVLTNPVGGLSILPRVKPPAWIDDNSRGIWHEIVANCAADHFQAGDAEVLARFCEAAWIARAALASDDVDLWLKVARIQALLATRLRLCPSTRSNNHLEGRKARRGISPASIYERMAQEDGAHDE